MIIIYICQSFLSPGKEDRDYRFKELMFRRRGGGNAWRCRPSPRRAQER